MDFVQEIDKKHKGKTVVVVSHADQIAITKECVTGEKCFGENIELPKTGVPHTVKISSAGDAILKRIPEVLDVWMDSASMPYAQVHYPFENVEKMEASFPADFIAEYTGQIRAWFYVMHVLGVLVKGSPAFKNVAVT